MNFMCTHVIWKKLTKNATFGCELISQKIFTAVTPTVSHFKVHKMGFSGKSHH